MNNKIEINYSFEQTFEVLMAMIEILLNQRSQFSASNLKIADFIIENQQQFSEITSQVLAGKVNVSQSSIIKFTQKLGFKGFTAFKLSFIKEYSHRTNLINSNTPLHSKINIEDSCLLMAQKLIQEKENALKATTNALNIDQFEKIIQLISKAPKVQIMGIGGSALTAKDLSFKLLKLSIVALSEQDTHIQIATANTLKKGDVQILISYSGNRKEIIIAAQSALNQGAVVVALTSPKQSPLRKMASYSIDTIADEDKHRSSSISSRTAQHAITDLIFMSLLHFEDRNIKMKMDDITTSVNRI